MQKRPGRPKKARPGDPNDPQGERVLDQRTEPYYGKRGVQYSIAERIRERTHPDLIFEYWALILEGKNPVWVKSVRGNYRVEPDPNPLLPSPTLADRTNAIKELTNRGWGLPVQSVQIDAQLKATINNGVPEHLLKQNNYAALDVILKGLKQLEDGNTQDAEWSPVQEPCAHLHIDMSGKCPDCGLQEPCQVTEATGSQSTGDLQEPVQVNRDLQEVDQTASETSNTINENSAPEGDSSAL